MDYSIKAGKLSMGISAGGNRVRWSAEGLPTCNEEQADFWRAHIDDGYRRSMTVRSSRQQGSVSAVRGGLDITYKKLESDDGFSFAVTLTIHIRTVISTYESLEMWADIQNNSEARLNELQLPFMDMSFIGSRDRESDVYYKMNGLGERIANPWEALKSAHTEYMAADYNEIWDSFSYPSPASMAWFGVQSGGGFLYMGRHDNHFRTAVFAAGLAPRNHEPRFLMSISGFPLTGAGASDTTAHSIVSLNPGDWRTGSDIYGNWARSDWYAVPQKPQWVREMTGWQRIILRHQYGEVFFTYSDLPRVYAEGKKHGLDTLMVFGWWKGRFDNGYPSYEADPELGGEQGLRDAVKEVQALGGRVVLYTNGILIDVATGYYKETGCRICQKDIDGNEYRDHYQFSNDGMLMRRFGYKSFVDACQTTPEWRERLLQNGRLKLSFNPDSIFYDQIGGHRPFLCFDESHPHGSCGDDHMSWKLGNLAAINELLTDEQAFGSEFTVDAYAPYLDYHHGCQCGTIFGENACPELFLRTFPEPISTNRFLHDDRSDFRRVLNYHFIYGFRFDVSIYRGRRSIMSELPDYAKCVEQMIALRERYKDFFYYGRFVCDTDLELPQRVRKTEYLNEKGGRLFVLWNDSDSAVSLTILGRTVELAPQSVRCLPKKE